MEDVVIKVKSKEHGKKVIKYFKKKDVNTKGMEGSTIGWYYGLFNGRFDFWSTPESSKVIKLPKKFKKYKKSKIPSTVKEFIENFVNNVLITTDYRESIDIHLEFSDKLFDRFLLENSYPFPYVNKVTFYVKDFKNKVTITRKN